MSSRLCIEICACTYMCEIAAVVINRWLEMAKKKTTKHTAPGIRWSSPTQLLIQRSNIKDAGMLCQHSLMTLSSSS
jgi:hypothetical protein